VGSHNFNDGTDVDFKTTKTSANQIFQTLERRQIKASANRSLENFGKIGRISQFFASFADRK
jgi:hypothetical protein